MRPPTAMDAWELPTVEPAQLGVGALIMVGGWAVSRLVRAVLLRYWTWRGRSPSFSRSSPRRWPGSSSPWRSVPG